MPKKAILAATVALALGIRVFEAEAQSIAGSALPTGGQIVGGQASISQNGAALRIEQTSSRAAIDWQSFNVGAQASVTFNQPSASAIALNRVLGASGSEIFGRLSANGHVFLVNPNGILFGRGAQVDVGGLVASTLGMSPQDFMSGRYVLRGQGAPGSIVNQAGIRAPRGSVALIAPSIVNDGLIEAQHGAVSLTAANAATVDFMADGLVQIRVDEGALQAEIANNGVLRADGGSVTLTAKARDSLASAVINNSGIIEARTVENVNGVVRLGGGEVYVSGTIDVSAVEGTGGSVHVLGERVALVDSARIDASGAHGGGEVLIGGDFQGNNPEIQNAKHTYVSPDAVIDASASQNGDGGKVIVWSDERTGFYGTASARGGAADGDGGLIEISSKDTLIYRGFVDVSAALGKAGSVLFDPKDITIANVGLGTDLLVDKDQFAESSGSAVTFDADQITAITSTGAAVTLQANNDITVSEDIVTNNLVGAGGALTLEAGRSVFLRANITTDDAPLQIRANRPLLAGVVDNQRDPGAAVISMSPGTTINSGTALTSLIIENGAGLTNKTSGNIIVANIVAGSAEIINNGPTPGSSILRASSSSMITASEILLELDCGLCAGGGSIGTRADPIRVTASRLESHIHEASAGIFIASPIQGLTIGGVLFGGNVEGVQAITGGDISISVNGTLTTEAGNPAATACGGGTGGPICSGSGVVTLQAEDMVLGNSVTAIDGAVVLEPFSTNRDIRIDSPSPNVLSLSTSELKLISASTLKIGRTTDIGKLSVRTAISSADLNAGLLVLQHQKVHIDAPMDFAAENESLALAHAIDGNGTIQIGVGANIDVGSGQINASGQTVNIAGAPVLTSSNAVGFSAGRLFVDSSDDLSLNAVSIVDTLDVSGGRLGGTGTVIIPSAGTGTLGNATVDVALDNQGTLKVAPGASAAVNGALTNSGTIRIRAEDCCGNATLTVANGLTNDGRIELENSSNGFTGTLNVVGTLTNAAQGEIRSVGGSATAVNTLNAQLTNLGTLRVDQPLVIVNTGGTFDSSAGTLELAAGKTLTVRDGTTRLGSGTTFVGTGTIDLAGTHTLDLANNLTLPAGGFSLGLSGAVTVSSATAGTDLINQSSSLVLSNDTIAASVDLHNQGTLTVAPGTSGTVNGTLMNSGMIRVRADDCCGNATLTVAKSFTNDGTIELENSSNGFTGTLNVVGTLTNAAGHEIRSIGGSATAANTLNAQLTNLGTLRVDQSLLIVNAGRTFNSSAGTLELGAGKTLTVSGGTTRLGGGTTFVGTGTIDLAGTHTLDLASSLTLPAAGFSLGLSGAVTVSSATPGTDLINQSSSFTLSNDTIAARVDLHNQGTLTVAPGTLGTVNGALTNTGTIAVRGNDCCGSATLTVASGFTNAGTIELANSANGFTGTLNVTTGTLTNAAGHEIRSVGASATAANTLNAQLANLGTLHVDQPLVIVNAGRTFDASAGTLDLAAGTTLTVRDGTTRLGGGTTFVGTGTIDLAGTHTLDLASNLTLPAAGFSLGLSGTVTVSSAVPGTDLINQSSDFTLSNDIIAASVDLDNQGTLTVAPGTSGTVNGALANSGMIAVRGNDCCGNATLTVASGFTNNGTIELGNSANGFTGTLNVTTGTLTNAARHEIRSVGASATATNTLNAQLANLGTIDVQRPVTITKFPINDGTITLSNDSTLSTNNTSLTNAATGVVQGIGTLDLGGATLTNDGTIRAGTSPGTLNINGALVLGPTSVIDVEVQSPWTTTGMDFDVIDATGGATLDGTLNIVHFDGAAPPAGQQMQVFNAVSVTKTFTSFNPPSGSTYTVLYNPANVTIQHDSTLVPPPPPPAPPPIVPEPLPTTTTLSATTGFEPSTVASAGMTSASATISSEAGASSSPVALSVRPHFVLPDISHLIETMSELRKKKVYALENAVRILERDPAAADLPSCAGEASGNCIAERPARLGPRDASERAAPELAHLWGIERKIALLIGVEEYQDPIPRLGSPLKDIAEIGRLYREQFGYEVRALANADKASIVREINRLILETRPSDSVVVFYAGHGHVVEKTGRGYWIPGRAGGEEPTQWISNSDIAKMLANIPARQVLLVSDSCYSGTLTREGKVEKSEVLPDPRAVLERRSVTVLSSGGEEPVADAGKDGHSVFAWHFIRTLGRVAQWSNGVDIYERLAESVQLDFPQQPQYGAALGAGHEPGADFLFEVRRY